MPVFGTKALLKSCSSLTALLLSSALSFLSNLLSSLSALSFSCARSAAAASSRAAVVSSCWQAPYEWKQRNDDVR